MYARGSQTPLGRIGKPEDIAKAAFFFIEPNSAYITGQSLCVNGGAIMQ
ncbi:SDR family oxidoreductase [Virgibacillus dakarensis]|nr:SDR family oxidoreductase [Virgibacillus dakarensis]